MTNAVGSYWLSLTSISESTWDARYQEVDMHSGIIVDDRWFQEAAEAFLVATMYEILMCAEGGAHMSV